MLCMSADQRELQTPIIEDVGEPAGMLRWFCGNLRGSHLSFIGFHSEGLQNRRLE
jgi:hypothetical protein